MQYSLEKYSAFFGRKPDSIMEPDPSNKFSPYIYRFPPVKVNFLKKIFTQLHDSYVFITEGISMFEMPVPEEEAKIYPKNIEFFAYTPQMISGNDDKRDIISSILQFISIIPFQENIFFGPLHTFDFGKKLTTNVEMEGIFFSIPEKIDLNRLNKCTPNASIILNLVPVTRNELDYAKEYGSEKLLEKFEQAQLSTF